MSEDKDPMEDMIEAWHKEHASTEPLSTQPKGGDETCAQNTTESCAPNASALTRDANAPIVSASNAAPTGPIPADAATPRTTQLRLVFHADDSSTPSQQLDMLFDEYAQLERELTQALKERDEAFDKPSYEELRLRSERDSLRAQLAAVTLERDNLAAWKEWALAGTTPKKAVEYMLSNPDPDHNPANLTPEQYGAADGWRLLKRSEIHTRGEQIPEIECWNRAYKNWITHRFYGACDDEVYRTRLSPAELAALRAKGAE